MPRTPPPPPQPQRIHSTLPVRGPSHLISSHLVSSLIPSQPSPPLSFITFISASSSSTSSSHCSRTPFQPPSVAAAGTGQFILVQTRSTSRPFFKLPRIPPSFNSSLLLRQQSPSREADIPYQNKSKSICLPQCQEKLTCDPNFPPSHRWGSFVSTRYLSSPDNFIPIPIDILL